MKNIKYKNHLWIYDPNSYDDLFTTTIDDKFIAKTWKFGGIHQATVDVIYDHKVNGKAPEFRVREEIHIGLEYGKTRKEAMQNCLNWIDDYKKNGAPSVENSFEHCFKYFSSIFKTREDILEQWLFTGGNGYDWLDGSLINSSPYDYKEVLRQEKYWAKMDESMQKAIDILDELKEKYNVASSIKEEKPKPIYGFSLSGYSKICKVPDDVRSDWLAVAYEAAIMLRDTVFPDSVKGQEENRKRGKKIVEELEKRFPQLTNA